MRVALIGASGQLGTDVCEAFRARGDEVTALNHSDIEIADAGSVSRAFENAQYELIVNTAAFHNVEMCEANPAQAFAVNGIGARNLALAARRIGAVLMHISTDYVFDGCKTTPYEESDIPRPLNAYGNTKLAGEHFVSALHGKSFVVRTSALYGHSPCRAKGGLNFVELMLKLGRERDEVRVVDAEWVSPTATKDLAEQLVQLSCCAEYGLYHATAEGMCSWYEFAREIFRLAGVKTKLTVAAEDEFPTKVPRPKYSVLENGRLKLLKINVFGFWQTGLKRYLGA